MIWGKSPVETLHLGAIVQILKAEEMLTNFSSGDNNPGDKRRRDRMNTSMRAKWIVCCTAAILSGTTLAQVDHAVPPSVSHIAPTNHAVITPEPGQSQQFCHAKELIGADVKDTLGHKLGSIHDILVNPKNGEAFVAVAIGGEAYAMVPSQALKVTTGTGSAGHETDVTLNATRESLLSGPMIRQNQWEHLDNPGFTDSVYIHYHLPAPSVVGGAGAPGGVLNGADRGISNKAETKP